MKIVIAPDSFKESADAVSVARAIAVGAKRACPGATIDCCPMADGGQGTTTALVSAAGGDMRSVSVLDPLTQPIDAYFGWIDSGQTAVVETAAASGLMLLPPALRDATRTTTFGTGQLIAAALSALFACGHESRLAGRAASASVPRVIVGLGGSATNDGGAGAAQALGVRFLNEQGKPIVTPLAGGDLGGVARIDRSDRHPLLARVDLIIACDVDNPYVGPRGASAVYGPQKGASPDAVARLDANLRHLADVIERDVGVRIHDYPGAGAAGGLGGGLIALCGGHVRRGVEIVIDATHLADRLRGADLCITGEGRLDHQSLHGKTAIGVARLAKSLGVPAIAIVGSAGEGANAAIADCLHSFHAIKPDTMPLSEAIARTTELLENTTACVVREWMSNH